MKPTKPLKTSVSMTIDNDVLEKVRDYAEYDGRPLSQYVNMVLRAHVAKIEAGKKKG